MASNKELARQQRAQYRSHFLRPKDRKRRKGSGTPGKTKSEACQADQHKKYFAKSSRSYKHPDYPAWSDKHRGH